MLNKPSMMKCEDYTKDFTVPFNTARSYVLFLVETDTDIKLDGTSTTFTIKAGERWEPSTTPVNAITIVSGTGKIIYG